MLRLLISLAILGFVFANPTARVNQSTQDNLLETTGDVEKKLNILAVKNAKSEIFPEEEVSNYLKTHDISVDMPSINSQIVLSARNLDDGELNLKLKASSASDIQARKSKIKKIFIPLLIFIFFKALVLTPLALGVFAIKTWNAVQLASVSFVTALALAVWKLCSKVNHDAHPQIIHSAWDPHHHDRSDAQQMAYSAYDPQQQIHVK